MVPSGGSSPTWWCDPTRRRWPALPAASATTRPPAAARGRTDVHIPRLRHYAAGFLVRYTGGLVLAYEAGAPSGLRVVENPGGLNAGVFAWDEARQVLTIREWLSGQPTTLEVLPG